MPVKRPPEAFHSRNLFENGIGYVSFCRFKSSGHAECSVFLLDMYCLGVKNALFTQMTESEYEDVLERLFSRDGRDPLEPCCARKLVEDAVAYAKALGLSPHSDYKAACRVFGGTAKDTCDQQFAFGKDGKPFFIQGPDDTPEKCRRVLALLKDKCGSGNYHYLMLASDFPEDA